jgi:hypothetical protein
MGRRQIYTPEERKARRQASTREQYARKRQLQIEAGTFCTRGAPGVRRKQPNDPTLPVSAEIQAVLDAAGPANILTLDLRNISPADRARYRRKVGLEAQPSEEERAQRIKDYHAARREKDRQQRLAAGTLRPPGRPRKPPVPI